MRKGISLIVLVITIIVIIILAGSVILSLSQNNPISSSVEAVFKSNMDLYNSELTLAISNKYFEDFTFNPNTLNATTDVTVKGYIPSISDTDATKYVILGGKLVFYGTIDTEKQWAQNSGIIVGKYDFNYTGTSQIFTAATTGTYKIELWGSQGGGTVYKGMGGYTSGLIQLIKGTQLYVYVGQAGMPNYTQTTFNGGGGSGNSASATYMGGNSGGGATDVRLIPGLWDNIDSLKSRIMVAGGGGGTSLWTEISTRGGNAGGLNGENGVLFSVYSGMTQVGSADGATQTTGFAFGIGGKSMDSVPNSCAAEGKGGGGGGYYGGNAQQEVAVNSNAGGGGGSSFISGYIGCNAINLAGIHTGQSNHYSGYIFVNSEMIPGNVSMSKPSGGSEIGHAGNGYCKITFVGQ